MTQMQSDIMMEENKIEQRASNRGKNERDNGGYEEFLALLASPSHKEMPAATPSLASSSTSMSTVALAVSEQRDRRCVSLARCNVDIDFDPTTTTTQDDGPYFPPSAQAPDDRNAGHATSDDGHCESFAPLLLVDVFLTAISTITLLLV